MDPLFEKHEKTLWKYFALKLHNFDFCILNKYAHVKYKTYLYFININNGLPKTDDSNKSRFKLTLVQCLLWYTIRYTGSLKVKVKVKVKVKLRMITLNFKSESNQK